LLQIKFLARVSSYRSSHVLSKDAFELIEQIDAHLHTIITNASSLFKTSSTSDQDRSGPSALVNRAQGGSSPSSSQGGSSCHSIKDRGSAECSFRLSMRRDRFQLEEKIILRTREIARALKAREDSIFAVFALRSSLEVRAVIVVAVCIECSRRCIVCPLPAHYK
jgi:hypothetical protein